MKHFKKNLPFILTILLISLCIFQILFLPIKSFAQQQEFSSTSSTEEAVTSTNDAIIKSILIISQVSVLGITFNNIFFQIILKKNIHQINRKKIIQDYIYDNFSYEKRFSKIVLLCSIFLIFASTGTILLQAYQLSQQMQLDTSTAFSILFSTSVGQVWIIRIITALIIIGLVVAYYILKKRRKGKDVQNQIGKKGVTKSDAIISSIVLSIILIAISINLFSNSMVSHSKALTSFSLLAVSIDWLHFMAVSIWIGGLFYISTILLKRDKIPVSDDNEYTNSSNTNYENSIKKDIRNTYQISILLTYFSFVAIVSLGIIGITGLYLAVIHLQSLSAILNTLYGNILIIKLSLAFPMILIGRYNKIKIQEYIKITKNIVTYNSNNNQDSNIFIKDDKKRDDFFYAIKKSIKIESLIGISVLIAASFLSITSPPSLAATNQGINESNTITNISTNTNNIDFSALVVILSIIIAIVGLLNFRKNQQKVTDIYV